MHAKGKKLRIHMRRYFLIIAFLALLVLAPQYSVAQQSSTVGTELVDSTNKDGIDAFSDTTAVDTGRQTVVAVADADSDDGFSTMESFTWSTEGMPVLVMGLLVMLVGFAIILLPLILLILFVWLLVRRDRKKRVSTAQETVDDRFKELNMNGKKRLCRSDDRLIGGVCAGLAEYFDFDPTLVRVAYALITLFTGFSGIPCYLILWLVMPSKY